jgi:hypothetical protein
MSFLPKAHHRDEGQQVSRRSFLRSAAVSTLALQSMPSFGLLGGLSSGTPTQSPAGGEIRITLLPGVAGHIGEDFCGLSYEKSQIATSTFTGENRNLIGLLRRLGTGVLRIGGNSADQFTWERSGTGRSRGKVGPPDVDGVAALARATGWKVLYGVNLAQSTPELVADEVAYATGAFGPYLSGIEIGNEPDGFVGAKYFPSSWKYSDYIARWRTFANAILQRSPNTVLTGPAVAGNINWFKSFATDAPKQVRLLTLHYYRADGHLPSSDAKFLASYPDVPLVNKLREVRATAEAVKLPFRIAETNSFWGGGSPNVSDSYTSALWVIDYLFTLAAGFCEGANFHGGGNGAGYTPIADLNGNVIGPRPEYYGIYLFTLAGQGELRACRCDSAELNVTAYAVEAKSGGINIVVVNKELRDISIVLDLTEIRNGNTFHSSSATLMTNTSLSATTGTTIGGSTINLDGSIKQSTTDGHLSVVDGRIRHTVPPISAALLRLN